MKAVNPLIIENVNGKIRSFFNTSALKPYINGPYKVNCVAELDETGQVLLVLIHLNSRNDIQMGEFEREIPKKIKESTHHHIHYLKDFMGNVLILKFQTQYSLKSSIVKI